MTSWLPERLHDLIYRMDTQYIEAGNPKSSDYIFIWEENNEIVSCILSDGYKLVYGDEYTDEDNKWSACNLGFHPDLENPNYRNSMTAYNTRKKSSMYKDSFECLIIDEK